MIKIIITLVMLLISFTSISQQNLKYFDREMITKYNINKIYEMISFDVDDNFKTVRIDDYFNTTKKNVGTPWRACRNDYYIFDNNSNIQYRKKTDQEQSFYFEYNDTNQMVNYYSTPYPFENFKIDINFKEYLGHDSDLFERILNNYQRPLDKLLSSKTDYNKSHFYDVRSLCSGIRAKYKITIVEQENGLPVLLKGQFVEYLPNERLFVISNGNEDFDRQEFEYAGYKYNKDIYIYYYYKLFDD
jgi:hypothetical protein